MWPGAPRYDPCKRWGMRIPCLLMLGVAVVSGCSGSGTDDGGPASVRVSTDPAASGVGQEDDASHRSSQAGTDGGAPYDAGHADAATIDAGPACKKHLTVVFAVGTGAGAVASHSNGCWTVIDADGAANPQYRKCSTGKLVVQNPGAPNYAFDDTNPNAPLSSDQSFLGQCSFGAAGDGFEYMAYRGSWRLLTAPHINAYFAELYSTDQMIDDYFGLWPTTLSGQTVSPMINIGPNDPPTIKSSALKMCQRVADHGYFGVYNGAYKIGMGPTDARALALVAALDSCTL